MGGGRKVGPYRIDGFSFLDRESIRTEKIVSERSNRRKKDVRSEARAERSNRDMKEGTDAGWTHLLELEICPSSTIL